jgi:hypothetical protein
MPLKILLLLLLLLLLYCIAGTPEQAALVRSELLLTQRLQELSHELSDASLQQVGMLPAACLCYIGYAQLHSSSHALPASLVLLLTCLCCWLTVWFSALCSPMLHHAEVFLLLLGFADA